MQRFKCLCRLIGALLILVGLGAPLRVLAANEIQGLFTTGKTCYAVVWVSSGNPANVGKFWNVTNSAFEAGVAGNWSSYVISTAEPFVGAAIYFGNFPAIGTAGVYSYAICWQTGATPQISDQRVASGSVNWDTTQIASIGLLLPAHIAPGTNGGLGTVDASNQVKSNVTAWTGNAVLATNQNGVPIIDVGFFRGTASAGAVGYAGVDWAAVANKASTVGLTGTTVGATTGVTNAVPLPANPPAGFLVNGSYGTAPTWYTAPTDPWGASLASYSNVAQFGGFLKQFTFDGAGFAKVDLNLAQLLDATVLPLTNASANSVGNAFWSAVTMSGKQATTGTSYVVYEMSGATIVRSFTLSVPVATAVIRQ